MQGVRREANGGVMVADGVKCEEEVTEGYEYVRPALLGIGIGEVLRVSIAVLHTARERDSGRLLASYRLLKLRWENAFMTHATTLEERMTVAEASMIRAEVRASEHPGAPIGLRGEFDLFELRSLRKVLDGPPQTASEIRVDLSGVTFLDAQCARELVIRSFPRGGRLRLCDPSREAYRSLQACASGLTGGSFYRTENHENGGYEWT